MIWTDFIFAFGGGLWIGGFSVYLLMNDKLKKLKGDINEM